MKWFTISITGDFKLDYTRQQKLLNPTDIGKKTISLVGVGATGSYIASMLAQFGWGNTPLKQGVLKVFDGDIVAEHNLANQIYEQSHVGMPKVEALKEIILRKCGFKIEAHNEMVTDQESVKSNYVMLLTDTMSSRKEIFEKCIKRSFNTDLVIETRMGLRNGRIYAFNPHSRDEVEQWMQTLYTDEEAETSLCGASESIITTVMFIASIAAGRIIQHFNCHYGNDNLRNDDEIGLHLWNEVQFSLYPESFYLKKFNEEPVMAMRETCTS